MTKEELAAKLNDRGYGGEISGGEELQARESGLVVIFGYSDDNMELRGAIHEEVGCWDGGEVFVTRDGLLQRECDNDDCPYFDKIRDTAVEIAALWCAEGKSGPSWTYKTAIPHSTFNVIEDGDVFCRGIVFALADAALGKRDEGEEDKD